MKYRVIILVVAILLIAGGIYLLAQSSLLRNPGNESGNETFCTQDVFECPDGSFVGRNPDNNCELNACPSTGVGGTFPEGTETQTHEINISDFAFSPDELTIQIGDTVIWTNLDSSGHTVTSDSGSELDSSTLSKNGVYSHTFDTPGNFSYYCKIHPSMKGTIIVE